jgi:hypothetical protein
MYRVAMHISICHACHVVIIMYGMLCMPVNVSYIIYMPSILPYVERRYAAGSGDLT